MTKTEYEIWGLMAVFESPEALVEAVKKTQHRGYKKYDAYSPFPLDELFEAMELKHCGVAAICWISGFIGAASGFAYLTWTTVVHFALDSGGRPLFSWPAYVPITFELMVLFGGCATFFAVLVLNGLPRFYRPEFNIDEFQRRNSSDGFFLVIEAEDQSFSIDHTRDFLLSLQPARIYEVPDVP